MKKTTIVILTTALLGGAAAALADSDEYRFCGEHSRGCASEYGYPGRGHHGFGHEHGGYGPDAEHRVGHLSSRLGLDAAQSEKVRAIGQRFEKEFDAVRAKMWDNRRQLRDLMAKDGVSDEDARKLADAHGKLQAEVIVLRNRMQREIDAVLTPEQRTRHRMLREQFGPRHS